MLKSKFSTAAVFLTIIVVALFAIATYDVTNSLVENAAVQSNLEMGLQLLWFALVVLCLYAATKLLTRRIVVEEYDLEVNYFFGCIKKRYPINELRFSYYSWTMNAIILQMHNGDQMVIGKSLYSNFADIVHVLDIRIKHEKLISRFANRLTILVVAAVILLFLMLISNATSSD